MAELAYKQAGIAGTVATPVAASGGGDTVQPDPHGAVLVNNGDASPMTVTVVVPGNTKYGQADPDVAIEVAAGTSRLIGPFPQDLADPSDGLVHLTYSAVTAVTVAAVRI